MRLKSFALPLIAALCLVSCGNEEANLSTGISTINETKSVNALANKLLY